MHYLSEVQIQMGSLYFIWQPYQGSYVNSCVVQSPVLGGIRMAI